MSSMLEGLKVIDMGQVEAVPVAAMWMADWGAEVIKVEPPPVNRPPAVAPAATAGTGTQPQEADVRPAFAQVVNRNKTSLAVDLKKEPGRDIVYRLVRRADVFMSNYQRDSLKKLRMDYDTLRQINPGIIYAVLSAYGSQGPDKDLGGYDFSAGWSRSGWQDLTREPGVTPARLPHGVIDRSIAAPHLLAGILGALLCRERTGKGEEPEVSLFQSSVWTMAFQVQSALLGRPWPNTDRQKAQNPLENIYRTKDNRWIEVSIVRPDRFWPDFCQAIERPELENDHRFNSVENRAQNCEQLIQVIDEAFATKTLKEWDRRLRAHNLIFAPVQTHAEVINDPQALANDFFVNMDHPAGRMKVVATPVKFRHNPASVRTLAPQPGQNNEEILLDLDYTADDITSLKEQEVIPY